MRICRYCGYLTQQIPRGIPHHVFFAGVCPIRKGTCKKCTEMVKANKIRASLATRGELEYLLERLDEYPEYTDFLTNVEQTFKIKGKVSTAQETAIHRMFYRVTKGPKRETRNHNR